MYTMFQQPSVSSVQLKIYKLYYSILYSTTRKYILYIYIYIYYYIYCECVYVNAIMIKTYDISKKYIMSFLRYIQLFIVSVII